MKKRMIAFLAALVLVAVMLPTALADGGMAFRVTADKTEAKPGNIVTFTVSVNSSASLGSIGLKLTIPEGLSFVVGSGTLLKTKADFGVDELSFTESPNMIYILADASFEELVPAGSYDLMTFKCTVDDDAGGKLAVGLDVTDAYDGMMDEPGYTVKEAEVTITGAAPACKHANTEVRNEKGATYAEAGYTGDIYCKDCGNKIASGEAVAALGHESGDGTVTKATDKDAEGERLNTYQNGETNIKAEAAAGVTEEVKPENKPETNPDTKPDSNGVKPGDRLPVIYVCLAVMAVFVITGYVLGKKSRQ